MNIDLIYKKYFHDIFLYIRSLSGDEHLAEEITQETFFRAMRQIGQFQEQQAVRAWLYTIARNTYYRYCRRRKLYSGEDIPDGAKDTAPPILEGIIEKEAIRDITQITAGIPEPYRQVFRLRVYDQCSFEDIGTHYGKSAGWARVTYHRAKKMIQNRLHTEKGWD